MYALAQIGFALCTLVCLMLIFIGLWKALEKTNYPSRQKRKIFTGSVGAVVLWMLIISGLSYFGLLRDFSIFPPRILPVLFLPLAASLIITFRPGLKPILEKTPASWLVYIQSFRIVVELLLWILFIQDILPIQMTFEGQNFDVLVGLTAPVFAYFCLTVKRWPHRVLFYWNIAGLLLLANIVVIAILSFPTPLRVFMNDPPNTIVAEFPFVWLPGILVTIAYTMHFFSLRKMAIEKDKQNRQS